MIDFTQLKNLVIQKLEALSSDQLGLIPEIFRTHDSKRLIRRIKEDCDSADSLKKQLLNHLDEASLAQGKYNVSLAQSKYRKCLNECIEDVDKYLQENTSSSAPAP